MSAEHYPLWETALPLSELTRPLEFKFGLWSYQEGRLALFETGPNRRMDDLPRSQDALIVNCEHFRPDTLWKGAGVAIPVFSLRSERGYGIGEFAGVGRTMIDTHQLAFWPAAGAGVPALDGLGPISLDDCSLQERVVVASLAPRVR